jgi:hypothetical protein
VVKLRFNIIYIMRSTRYRSFHTYQCFIVFSPNQPTASQIPAPLLSRPPNHAKTYIERYGKPVAFYAFRGSAAMG